MWHSAQILHYFFIVVTLLWITYSYENKSDQGLSWTVVSPIVFTYRVIQCKDLLDPRNNTLLWGHIEDEELKGTMSNSKSVKRFIVIDKTVHQLYGSKVSQYFDARGVIYKILPLPTTEENKSMDLVTKILKEAHKFAIDRRSEPIIAIGGGVCLDVVGLAATLYRRRTPYIRVPTTLLSYIDASVGAKTGVNFVGGKNKLGSYVPPVATFLDSSFFQTLPLRQISNGLAEMLKVLVSAWAWINTFLACGATSNGCQIIKEKVLSILILLLMFVGCDS